MIRAADAGLVLLMVAAGCAGPEERLVVAAGADAAVECVRAEGIERVTFCGTVLSNSAADSLTHRLRLELLKVPERLGQVSNLLALPFECRLLLYSNPVAMELSGSFESPRELFEPGNAIQFASVVLARAPLTGKSCLTFVREFR